MVNISAFANMSADVTWTTDTWTNGSVTDAVHIAFLNPDTQMAVYMEAQAKRADGKLTVQLPGTWKGVTLHVWFFFTSADFQQSSVSEYLGTVVPA